MIKSRTKIKDLRIMKVLFDYQKTQEGYKLDMSCEEMSQLESGVYDVKEYHDCFSAILKHIITNHLSEVPKQTDRKLSV